MMPDREKVIEALVKARTAGENYKLQSAEMSFQFIEILIELLKEQEAVEPKTEQSTKGYWFTCGVCGWWLFEVRDTVHFDYRKRIRYCASCGRAVKWE